MSNKNFRGIRAIVLLVASAAFASLAAQNANPQNNNLIIVSDAQRGSAPTNQLSDRITLIDESVLVGKISEMSPARVVIKVAGTDFVVDPARIAKVERNINAEAAKQRQVSVVTKDGSKYRGQIARADGATTVVKTSAGEIPVRNDNIERIDYLDNDRVRQEDAIAARPAKWELSLKGGSMFYQAGTYNGLLSPGYFGLLQIQHPEFSLPVGLRLAMGLQAGYVQNSGKNVSSTALGLFPGLVTATVNRQIGNLPIDVFAGGMVGVSLTRAITSGAADKLSLDFAYGAELGVKYYFNEHLTFRLAGMWLAVSESTATLNHIGAYASAGWMF
ncbi:MAG: hypothetical protein JSR44_11990 [Spirochaetes bacterium]|nr:hypothetical protein [Spirochaetota bacterium]